jgi:hypothetical protein
MAFGVRASSTADRVARHMAEHSKVDWCESASKSRRSRLESDPPSWLRHYLGSAYSRQFDKPHHAIINGAMTASESGGRFVVAAQRGIGKSTVLWGIVLMLACTGKQPFPVCVPWAAGALKRAFRFWRAQLCFNDALFYDYPEICAPFRHCKGSSQKLAHTTWRGGPNDGKPTGSSMAIGEGLIVLPDNRGCIGGATINGNPRGLNHPTPDGRVIRPTLALLDDVQDRGTAKSRAQILETIEVIDGDVAGMGEAGTNLPMLMSGNCIAPGDVMDHYLGSDKWESLRVPCIEAWPKTWDDGKGRAAKLWLEWFDLYRSGKGATAHYRKHKRAMTTGMSLSAPGTFRREKNIPDAFCSVMLSYFKMGEEAFHAEYQQKPLEQGVTLYNLTPDVIVSRTTDRKPGDVPEWVRVRVAATDVNPSYGLSWSLLGFGPDQTSAVIGYGIHEMSVAGGATEAEKNRAIYEALVAHGKRLAALPCRPELWFIDAGGAAFDVVLRFAAEASRVCGISAIGATGRGARNYRPYGKSVLGRPREQCHLATDTRGRKWVAWNADYWREQAQKAWTGSVGAPGSCSLPAGHHRTFAEQICREQLAGKGEIGGQMVWTWNTQPGPHDYGDAMAMCYMGAAWAGIGTGGTATRPPPRRRETRKSKVEMTL